MRLPHSPTQVSWPSEDGRCKRRQHAVIVAGMVVMLAAGRRHQQRRDTHQNQKTHLHLKLLSDRSLYLLCHTRGATVHQAGCSVRCGAAAADYSGGRVGHFLALLRTMSARLGAPPTMFDVVLLALFSARVAYFRADIACGSHLPRSPAHEGRCKPADLRAIDADAGAVGAIFLYAGLAAVLTFLRALHARFDA